MNHYQLKPIRVSDNRHFLVTDDGKPFFWLGDTAWELFHRLTLDEIIFYLDTRQRQGFNVVQAVALAEQDGLRVPNANGDLPFTDSAFTQPNEAYFRLVDSVIELAAERGIYIALLPTWGDKVRLAWGSGPVIFDPPRAQQYGEWLGARYRGRENVFWINGGDRPAVQDGVDDRPVWEALARGVRRGFGAEALISFHPPGGCGSSQYFPDADWLSLHMWQSGHVQVDAPNWEYITQDWERSPTKPTLDGEPCYEDHPIDPFLRHWQPEYGYFRDYEVRKQAYRAVFAGACGHTYGHHSIWQFYDSGRAAINFPWCDWREALERPGAQQMRHLRALIEALPFTAHVPDQSIVLSDTGTGSEHIRAIRDGDGRYVLVYIPTAERAVTLDARKLHGERAAARWYDPRTGEYVRIGTITAQQPQTFVTPPQGPDWVLMLAVE